MTVNELIATIDMYKSQVIVLETQLEKHMIQMEDTHMQQVTIRDGKHEVRMGLLMKEHLLAIGKLKTEHEENILPRT